MLSSAIGVTGFVKPEVKHVPLHPCVFPLILMLLSPQGRARAV